MKKTDPRWNDSRITEGSGNVFVDLGFDTAEAEVLALRTETLIKLSEHLRAQSWTQAEMARRLRITQPRQPPRSHRPRARSGWSSSARVR